MIDKKTYLNLKREIRLMCRANVIKLCDDMQLNKYERNLLMHFYDGNTKTKTCIDLNISSTCYSEHLKILFTKINDYKNTLE